MFKKFGIYEYKFFKYSTGVPLNGYQGEEGVCYTFTYGNIQFVMLNNEDMATSAGLSRAQEWVRKVLKSSTAKFKVVCEHYQWFYGECRRGQQVPSSHAQQYGICPDSVFRQ